MIPLTESMHSDSLVPGLFQTQSVATLIFRVAAKRTTQTMMWPGMIQTGTRHFPAAMNTVSGAIRNFGIACAIGARTTTRSTGVAGLLLKCIIGASAYLERIITTMIKTQQVQVRYGETGENCALKVWPDCDLCLEFQCYCCSGERQKKPVLYEYFAGIN